MSGIPSREKEDKEIIITYLLHTRHLFATYLQVPYLMQYSQWLLNRCSYLLKTKQNRLVIDSEMRNKWLAHQITQLESNGIRIKNLGLSNSKVHFLSIITQGIKSKQQQQQQQTQGGKKSEYSGASNCSAVG